ncbi:uncharacterized protein LOC129720033 [Wyeomyia smithii]|uniref:uncharacterized protein LOC129720033 n=1 Tax=Wyeomyia smithii TaxID=174621 RepID=UPI0024680BC0|nr:uncharacterized protein LOC129720033 [Wyeomyia smithii]
MRKIESPKPDKLATFILFGNAIEQLCEHLEAADLQQHLVNPILIQDLVDKLPAGDKREWVRFKRIKGEVTLTGPDLFVPLVTVLAGIRKRRIAFGGDTREMYHQLRIIATDKQAQRFLFRMNKEVSPSVYVMDVAIFGTCSPCSAQFVKNKNATEYASEYPEAAAAIIKRHYVDDYFDSVDTEEEAIRRAKEITFVQSKAGFEIRNWVPNSSTVRRSLGETEPAQDVYLGLVKSTGNERVLGIVWSPSQDTFSFSTEHREQLQEYLTGSRRKILIQELWRSGCSWDEAIDDNSWPKWKRWIGLLPRVEAIRIPRCYIGDSSWADVDSAELHMFTDASEYAYGCVGYLRAVVHGTVRVTLLMARSKVAPLKRQSIPRLELMAAVTGARLLHSIITMHFIKFDRFVLWTNSQTVRSWICSDQHKFKQFVAFRVGEILELTRPVDWRWDGPNFLYNSEDKWPSQAVLAAETSEEARTFVLHHDVKLVQGVIDGTRFSRWTRLLRSTAMVIRFLANCRRKKKGEPLLTYWATSKQRRMICANLLTECQPLQGNELALAETVLWKQVQSESFPDETTALVKNNDRSLDQPLVRIGKSSVLYKLNPVLDQNGVVREGGRMEAAQDLPFDKKYPIILSRNHDITKMLILSYHGKFGHANNETVFN